MCCTLPRGPSPAIGHSPGVSSEASIDAAGGDGLDTREADRNGLAHGWKKKLMVNASQFPDSISDSIHAVESAARVLDPEASKNLTPALNSLERAGVLQHPALKEAFAKLYGYTSDEQGIRHALLEQGSANVGLEEALFMFGACASFAAYLTEKHRQVKIVGS